MISSILSAVKIPAMPKRHSFIVQFGMMLVGTLWLAAGSWLQVPLFPVPMTFQTFALPTLAVAYGSRLGGLTVLLWLAEGAMGFPVFAGGAAGALHLLGPTGGYLWSFPIIALGLGWAAEKKLLSNTLKGTVIFIVAHAFCLACGAAWLAVFVGIKQAWVLGVTPFLLGSALKSLLAMITVDIARLVRRRFE